MSTCGSIQNSHATYGPRRGRVRNGRRCRQDGHAHDAQLVVDHRPGRSRKGRRPRGRSLVPALRLQGRRAHARELLLLLLYCASPLPEGELSPVGERRRFINAGEATRRDGREGE